MQSEAQLNTTNHQQELDDIREKAATSPESIEAYAKLMREQFCPMYLFGLGRESPVATVPIESLRRYVDDFVIDQVGDDCRSDPILRSLIEQLILANQMIGRLYADAISSPLVETCRTKTQLAISLTGELRRLSGEIRSQSERHRSAQASIAGSIGKKPGGGKKKELGSKAEVA